MVNIGVGYEDRLFSLLKVRNSLLEDLKHFILVAGVSAIDKQQLAVTVYNDRITAAGRLYQGDLCILGDLMRAYPRRKGFASG